jgi:hypothetical protein
MLQPILGCLAEVLASPAALVDAVMDLHERELVGGVVAVHGAWWGVVIVRCDRGLVTDDLLRRLATELTRAVTDVLDPTAARSAPVLLAADNALWEPSVAILQARVDARVGEHLVVVEVHRRRPSGESPAVGDDG